MSGTTRGLDTVHQAVSPSIPSLLHTPSPLRGMALRLLVLIGHFLLLNNLFAQTPDSLYTIPLSEQDTVDEVPPPIEWDTIVAQPVIKIDTLAIQQYKPGKPWERKAFVLPGLDQMRRYDPLDQPEGREYLRLHNLGTAAFAASPLPPRTIGFDVGLPAFEPYLLVSDSLFFLPSQTAFSDVYYSQGRTSEDGLFKGILTRRFGKGTDFTIEALRLYNVGDYQRMANHHSSLRAGMRYQNTSGRYSIALLHGNHVLDQEESGGIRTDTLLGEELYQSRIIVPVWLSQAKFRYRETDYQLDQHLALAGQVDRDSLGRLVLRHRFRWQDRSYKYSDPALDDTEGYYGLFHKDSRGIRQYTTWSTLSNLATALFSWQSKQGQTIRLETGVEHRWHRWDNELQSGNLQNVLLLAEAEMTWKEWADISGKGQFDVGDQVGSWYLEAQLALRLGQWINLSGGISTNRRFADLFEQQLVIARQQVYDHDWEVPLHQQLFGKFDVPLLKLSAGFALHLRTNALYYQAPGIPAQISGTFSQQHFWLRHALRVGPMHLEQKVSWQGSADERLPFPAWVTRHDLYYEGLWFRRSLRIRFGTELRLISPWKPYGYMPIHQAFYIQDSYESEWIPQIDGYVSAERLGFRFFLELENAGQMLFGWKGQAVNGEEIPRVFYQVVGYPMPENWLRFGIAFTFRG